MSKSKIPNFNPFEDRVDPRAQRAVVDAIDAIAYSRADLIFNTGISTSQLAQGIDDGKLTATQIRAMSDAFDAKLRDAMFGTAMDTSPMPQADILNCNVDWTIIPAEFIVRFGRDIAKLWVGLGNPQELVFTCADTVKISDPLSSAMPKPLRQYPIQFIMQTFLTRDKDGEDCFSHLRVVPKSKDDMLLIVEWMIKNL